MVVQKRAIVVTVWLQRHVAIWNLVVALKRTVWGFWTGGSEKGRFCISSEKSSSVQKLVFSDVDSAVFRELQLVRLNQIELSLAAVQLGPHYNVAVMAPRSLYCRVGIGHLLPAQLRWFSWSDPMLGWLLLVSPRPERLKPSGWAGKVASAPSSSLGWPARPAASAGMLMM